jgi:DNA-binding transcriptional MerR regulator
MLAMSTKAPWGGVWRVGQLAKAADVSPDTLRHYERKGLLRPQRSRNGYREYEEGALERVRMIRRALTIGFTLDELSTIFKIFDRGGAPCHQVRDVAATKLAEVEGHLYEVTAIRDELRESLKDWGARLAQTAQGERAWLLKGLTAREGVHSPTSILMHKPKRERKGTGNE